MSVPVQHFHKVQNADPMHIFAIIVDLYGRKMADEIAKELIKDAPRPTVVWPSY